MKKRIFLLFIATVILSSCNSNVERKNNGDSEDYSMDYEMVFLESDIWVEDKEIPLTILSLFRYKKEYDNLNINYSQYIDLLATIMDTPRTFEKAEDTVFVVKEDGDFEIITNEDISDYSSDELSELKDRMSISNQESDEPAFEDSLFLSKVLVESGSKVIYAKEVKQFSSEYAELLGYEFEVVDWWFSFSNNTDNVIYSYTSWYNKYNSDDFTLHQSEIKDRIKDVEFYDVTGLLK